MSDRAFSEELDFGWGELFATSFGQGQNGPDEIMDEPAARPVEVQLLEHVRRFVLRVHPSAYPACIASTSVVM